MARAARPKSLRDARLDANKWDRFYALMHGKEPANQQVVAPKREIVNRSDPADLEAAVMREVGEVIALSPEVLLAWRQNSGSIRDERGVPVRFYKFIKWSAEMTLVDYLCILRTGKLCALECKRRDWEFTGTDREVKQEAFIEAILRTGGKGGFCTSGEQALAILGG